MATQNQVAIARQGRGGPSSHLSRAARKVVPNFLQKLYEIVNDPASQELIKWSELGDSFYVLDHERFAHEVLGRWFKHNHFSSFVRQLNMYGFHKIPHLQQGVLKSDTDTELWNFEHPHFRRGQPDMLCLIQRRRQPTAQNLTSEVQTTFPSQDPVTTTPPPTMQSLPPGQLLDVNSLVTGISAIKRHQQAISADLSELKTSNQHLWQEAMAARERHKKHQDTINRILKFLASVFGPSAASPVHKHNDSDSSHPVIPRKRQRLMIAGGSKEKSKGVSVADEIDEDDLMSEVENQTPSIPFASISTPSASDLFSPAPEPRPKLSAPQLQSGSQTQNEAAQPMLPPSLVTSFSPNRAPSPNSTEVFQAAFNQMMSSPHQMQRLLQALSQSSFPMSQPSPPNQSRTTEQEANNQLTTYAPPHFNFDALLNHEGANPNSTMLLPQKSAADLPSTLSASKSEDLIPLFPEHDAKLQKTWADASQIADSVELMDSNIKTFIDDLGFDPSMFSQSDYSNNPTGRMNGNGACTETPEGVDNVEGEDVSGDLDLDFEDLLSQFSRQNDNDTNFGELMVPEPTDDGDTDQLTALLGDVASETSIRQHLPEAPLRKKRRSDIDMLDKVEQESK